MKVDGLIYAKNLLQDDKTDGKEAMILSLFINSMNYKNLDDKIENLAKYVQKKQIEQEFSDGKVADDKIETKANELQKIIQTIEEKEARWFELSSKIE